jgi:hypothetical protein
MHWRALGLGLLLGFCTSRPTWAEAAEPLSEHESSQLASGETVVREHTWEPTNDARFVGGITYTVLDGTTSSVGAIFDDIAAFRHILPATKRAGLVRVQPTGDRTIRLVQGTTFLDAEYSIVLHEEVASTTGTRELRFWLDPSLPHELRDVWGFFRLEPFAGPGGEPKVLLTYGILVDVGPGLVRELFEERIRTALLGVPQRVRRYMAKARQPGY